MASKEEKGKTPLRGNHSKDNAGKHKQGDKRKRSSSDSKSQPGKGPNAAGFKKTRFGGERPNGLQGASKLKASIRQTKRLLAKDTLAPGTRIEAERRLIALEQDLNRLDQFKLEKTRAAKYHGVKFFERQKLTRKVRKVKRQLNALHRRAQGEEVDSEQDSDDENEASRSNADAAQLKQSLDSYRELLHYVLQYPSDVKYVALFPDGIPEPRLPAKTDNDKTVQRAYQHLEYIRTAISQSKLSKEPETELELGDRVKKSPHVSFSSSNQPEHRLKQAKSHAQGAKEAINARQRDISDDRPKSGVREDDFFAQDSSDEE